MRELVVALTLAACAAYSPQSWADPKAEALRQQAVVLEGQGKGSEAVQMYVRAARSGSGKAARRLGEIYEKGLLGVTRDHAESVKWYNAAKVLGEDVDGGWGCPPKC
jgi:TPR repeat protein